MGFIDIHAHILPGVDDGARDMQEALKMLRIAEREGVTALSATPHCGLTGLYDNFAGPQLNAQLQLLRQKAAEAGIRVEICAGMEVYASEDISDQWMNGRLQTLNNSRYLLVEFDFRESPVWCTQVLERLCAQGCVPIIAHPERYYAVWREPWCVLPWLDMGCHLQLTRGSILGAFGSEPQKVSGFLLNRNLVACVASDAHGSAHRTPRFRDVHRYLAGRYSVGFADMLLKDNPEKILRDLPLIET